MATDVHGCGEALEAACVTSGSDCGNATTTLRSDAKPRSARLRRMTSTKRALILVVEDLESVRDLMVDVLRVYGYGVDMAPDGTEALRLCEQVRYDLILSDLRMPKMDGATLFQALRRRYGSLMPPVIFVTGQAYSPDYAGFLATVSVPVVSKPFTADDLRKAVARALSAQA